MVFVQVGAEIFRRALTYPIRKIAENAGVSGSVVVQKVLHIVLLFLLYSNICWHLAFTNSLQFLLQVLANDNLRYGCNAASNSYQDLMEAGIMDPTKV